MLGMFLGELFFCSRLWMIIVWLGLGLFIFSCVLWFFNGLLSVCL